MSRKIFKRIIYTISLASIVFAAAFAVTKSPLVDHLVYAIVEGALSMKAEFKEAKFDGLDLVIKDLKLKTQDGKEAIFLKKVRLDINPFIITRLQKIEGEDGYVTVIRNKNDINLANLFPSSETSNSRGSSLGIITFKNVNLKYIDKSFKKEINEDFVNVNGSFITNNKYIVKLEASAIKKNDNNQKLDINIDIESKQNQNIFKDITELSNYKEYKKELLTLGLNVKDFILDEKLSQYIDLEKVLKIYKVKGNGNFVLKEKENNDFSLYGNLKLNDAKIRYFDYYDDVDNINGEVKFDDAKINVVANTGIDKGKINFKLDTDLDKKIIDTKIDFKNLSYERLKKYELLKKFNIDAISNSVDGTIGVKLDFLNDKISLKDFEGIIKSNSAKAFNSYFENIDVYMKLNKKDNINVKVKDLYFFKDIKDVKIKEKINADIDILLDKNSKNIIEGKAYIKNEFKDINFENAIANFWLDKKDKFYLNANSDLFTLKSIADVKTKDFKFDINTLKEVKLKYQDKELVFNGNLKDVNFDLKKGKLDGGKININTKILGIDILDNINLSANINENGFLINSDIYVEDNKVNVKGIISNDLKQEYEISLENGNYKDFKNINLKAKISGLKDKLGGKFNIYSEYGGENLEYEKLSLDGNINDLKNLNIDINLFAKEIWAYYQKFEDVKGTLKLNKDILKILDLRNKNLNLIGEYNIKDKSLDASLKLNRKLFYLPSSPDINLFVDNFNMDLKGPLKSINGKAKIKDATLLLNGRKISDLNLNVNIKDSIVELEELKLRDLTAVGKIDLNDKNIDINIDLEENKISELINIEDANVNIDGHLKLTGKFDDINVESDLNINNIRYKKYKLPDFNIEASYKNGNMSNILNSGILEIKDLSFKNYKKENLITFKETFDLANFEINYEAKDKTIKLEDIDLFKEDENFKGNIKLNTIIRKNKDEAFFSIYAESDELVLNGVKVNDIVVDAQGDNNILNISQVYLEYEKNPLLLDGYSTFNLSDYSFSLLAKDFDLKFLGVLGNVEKSNGIANINFNLKNNDFNGYATLDNFEFKTKDNLVDINNFISKLSLKNKEITVEDISGNVNGGNVKLFGIINLPDIPSDFLTTKNIILKPISLKANIDKVDFKYQNAINLNLTSSIKIDNEKIDADVIVNNGVIENIPKFKTNNNQSISKKINYFNTLKDEILNNILKKYLIDLRVSTENSVKINIPLVAGIVKDIKGNVFGNSIINIKNSNIIANSNVDLIESSFELNGQKFNVEEANLKTEGDIDPKIKFKAISNIGGDNILIIIDGNLSQRNIELKSSNGKSTDEILGLLAFDQSGGLLNLERFKPTNLVGKALETTVNNLVFSSITSRVGRFLGLDDFSIKASLENKDTNKIDEIFDKTTTTLFIRDKIFDFNNFTWSAYLTLPVYLKNINNYKDEVKYNLGIGYKIKKSINAEIGIKSPIIETDKKVSFYTGIKFDNKYNYYSDFFEEFIELFRIRRTLQK